MAPNAASLSQEDRQTGTRAPSENQRVTRQQSAMRPQAENTSQDTIHVQPAPEATPPRTRRVAFNETHRSKIWDHEAQIGYLQRKDQFSSENFLKIEEKFTQLAEQNRQLEERVAQLAEQNQKLEEKVEQLTTENKKFDREIERLFENEEHQENHNKSLEKRIEESTIQAHQLTERLDTMSSTPQVNNQCWAAVAARPIPNFPPTYNTQSGNSPATLRITTAVPSTQNTFSRYMPTKTAAEHISQALKKHDRTRDASVLGVGTTKLGYLIRFKDEEAKKLATSNTEWTKTLGNDTAITQPQFGVVVHRTPTSEVDIEKKNDAIQKILQENSLVDAQIKNIAWMKKRDSPLGQHASLGIWFSTQEAAQNAIQNGLVFGQSYTNRVEPYRMERKRCHRCLQFGHLAWNCKKKERCAHCLAEHNKKDCSSDTPPKCADCNQSHPTGAAQCKGAMPYPLLSGG